MRLAFLIVASIIAVFNLWLYIKSLVYNKILFKRYHYDKSNDDYAPKVGVFVPCKGADKNLQNHLESIVNQSYKNFKVTYIVDDIKDPAVDIIKKVVSSYPEKTKLLVAGKAKKCGQKNHNLLSGIADDNNESDVYVFVDSDVQPEPTWLKELIRPLSIEDVPVTTSFRWLIPREYSISGALHSMMSAYLCILMSHHSFRGVWGGSTAIKRKEFNKLKIKKLWKTSVVDDTSLTKVLFTQRIKRVFVPTCLTVSYNTLNSFKEGIEWYSRQAAFLKAYLKPMWIFCVLLHSITTFIIIGNPFFILYGLYTGDYYYAIITSVFSFINMFCYGMMKFIYKDNQRFIEWFFISPVFQILGFYSLIKPGFSNSILWRNIYYELHSDGRVKSIKEIDKENISIV